jgi:hypothetical protein
VTREEKKMIRLQIIGLLDQCEGCKYRFKANACIHICPSCPIGQQIQKLGRFLCRTSNWSKRREKGELIRRPWTKEEDEYIWNNQHLLRRDLAKHLGRTKKAVIKRLCELRKRGGVTHAS